MEPALSGCNACLRWGATKRPDGCTSSGAQWFVQGETGSPSFGGWIEAPEEDVHGHETQDKAIVIVAAEQRGTATGRIRVERIADASAENPLAFVEASVGSGSLVIAD